LTVPRGRGPLRVEAIATALVRRSGGRVETEEITSFLDGYQELHPLRLAELWAFPSFLRLALLDALLIEASGEEVPVEVGAHILSLRALAAEDWRGIVESLSLVESVLRDDPAGVYPAMDFRTRDRYRRELEKIARQTGVDEGVAARRAVEMAGLHPGRPREGHVGHYILGEGKVELFRELGFGRPESQDSAQRRRRNGYLYFGSIALLSLSGLVLFDSLLDVGWPRPLFLFLLLAPVIGIAVTLTNRIAVHFASPRPLPRLDVRDGIPEQFRTVVAVPILLSSRSDIQGILHTLESNAQGNPDPTLSFALLSDFTDSERERTDADDPLLAEAAEGIRELNARYGDGGGRRFLLLHRARRWNPSERCWMGWERKRGKLSELNQLLLGRDSGLWIVEGDAERFERVSFVLTLDADTRLPRGAASRLVGALAHPLNRPEVGKDGEILRGYSILQPRIEILPEPDGGTLFSRVFGGVQGLDLYSHASFDVYQDLFDVGIFAGKGIYDVHAFEASLAGKTPENSLLSHDLFEGAHGRAGLVSDLVLLEDFPGHPLAYTRRAHRWIRGDWQILPWLFARVPSERGGLQPNRLSSLSRWMIADNLRRSLYSPSILLLLLLGWLAAPDALVAWTLTLVLVLGIPFLIGSVDAGMRASKDIPRRADLEAEARALFRALGRWVLEIAFLPVEALNSADAIGRALNRVYRTRTGLLEWTSAAATSRTVKQSDSLREMLRKMRVGPILALSFGGAYALLTSVSATLLTVLLLWFVSPLLAHLTSRPRRPLRSPRGTFPHRDARLLARRIWGYYERFQGPEGNWLAPDHYQEEPGGEVAYRTSPTNLGMAMVSTVVAWDLGFETTSGIVERTARTVEGMSGLERYRGHFLNWYSTGTRTPLNPLYVSTVDSGNLAAAFLVVRESLRESATRELWVSEQVPGLTDALRVLEELLRESRRKPRAKAIISEITSLRKTVDESLQEAWAKGLPAFVVQIETLLERDLFRIEEKFSQWLAEPTTLPPAEGEGEAVQAWLGLFRSGAEGLLGELLALFPWLSPELRGRAAAQSLHRRITREGTRVPSLQRVRTFLGREVRRIVIGEGEGAADPDVQEAMQESLLRAKELLAEIARLDTRLDEWYREMDFTFLFSRRRALFRIGFSISTGELDASYYDLLASEARIASLIALSKGEVPPAHWLHLGRPFGLTGRGPVLLSWAGTMFEYLMPTLFLRLPPDTVLEEGCRRAVQLQREHGDKERMPWGISESGYHVLSREGHYQYRAFGLAILGLRTELSTRKVVAPYASLMAISLAPGAVHSNLDFLRKLGGMGPWGPYEALDFGRGGEWRSDPHVVRSYMSHHHGMILAALGNHLMGNRIVERFHRDPRIASAEPFLFERIPWRRTVGKKWVDRTLPTSLGTTGPGIVRWAPALDRFPPPAHHLASGDLVVAVGADGRGGSRWKGWSVVRGGIGAGLEAGGPDLTLLDRETGHAWCPLPDPMDPNREDQSILFEAHRADFFRKTKGLRTRMEVFLPPVAGVEVREITIANESEIPRRLRLAYAMEVALAPLLDDRRHPAFHKLFVRAEILPGGEGAIFERRPRSQSEFPPVMLVSILASRGKVENLRWGTSREDYLGRSGSIRRPAALDDPTLLNSPTYPHHPLDPAAAAIIDFELDRWEELHITCLVAVGPDRRSVIRSASELRGPQRREWALIQARARLEGELLRLDAHAEDPVIWEEVLAHILHPRGLQRPDVDRSQSLDLRQSTLWKWGISGDIPFLLIEGNLANPSPLVANLARAQRWWRTRGERVDLVILDRSPEGYHDATLDRLRGLLSKLGGEEEMGVLGGMHLVRIENKDDPDARRLRDLATLRFDPEGPPLLAQLRASARKPETSPVSIPADDSPRYSPRAPREERSPEPHLVAPSAFGGFEGETGEYIISLAPGETTPAPWVNIIARDRIGFLVTESGGSFTWLEDAGEFRMTPWHNDPVRGLRGEVAYLRDEETGKVWTPSPGPLALHRAHTIRHGWGRTVLQASAADLEEEVSWFLHPIAQVKVVRVRLRNRGSRPRKISATFFADWVMGTHPKSTAGRLEVSVDPALHAILARNPYLLVHSNRVGFLGCDRRPDAMTVDRNSFLGGAGPLDAVPIGLRRPAFIESEAADRQGCGVLRRVMTLAPGESSEVSFYLGSGRDSEEIGSVLRGLAAFSTSRGGGKDPIEDEREHWEGYLGRVRVRTPEVRLDPLVNGWLPYQSIVSRLRGRTGFYQSGGAFGFRDQLQDVYALLPLDPRLAEEHLVEAAKRQFLQGDVLHWWHPGTNRGVRTRCSDDLLWLPWVLAQTIRWTGDRSLLDRKAPYLEAPALPDEEHEKYDAFPSSEEEGTLLEHAIRAIEHTSGLLSERGLPLIGTGDWNDGMDRVGKEGRGESIWLGWFFIDVCRLFAPLVREAGREEEARKMEERSALIGQAIEAHGWDGEWYRRAFFDDGSPLGSSHSAEAKIDSIAQSWGVISGAADPQRARLALDAAWERLVRRDAGIALLLTPPFAGEGPDPGYIAAYSPGVRENGGQYTHATAWLLRAFAMAGQGDRAGELLRLLLPTRHAEGEGSNRYRVEPYVAVADIYGVDPHIGRGGWSWYTGSAGWLWRVILEDILGVRREGETLRLDPCIPAEWDGFEIEIEIEGVQVEIRVQNPDRISKGVKRCLLNGLNVDPLRIPLTGANHLKVEAVLG